MDPAGYTDRSGDAAHRTDRRMRVPVIIFADDDLIRDIDENVGQQASNVATLPEIVSASYIMPDAHWGHRFPIGRVAAFDPEEGGVVSAGGVGFDVSCVNGKDP